jgi:hypothetical protein
MQRHAFTADGRHMRVRTTGALPSPIEEYSGHKREDHSPEHPFDDRRLGLDEYSIVVALLH